MNRAARRKLKAPPHISTTPQPQPPATQACHQPNKLPPVWTYSEILRRIGKVISWVVLYGLALLGGVSVFYDFSPKMSVSSYQLLDVADPFSAPFIIANEGYLSLHSVSATCLGNVSMDNHVNIQGMNVGDRIDIASEMLPGEKFTVACRFRETIFIPASAKNADIRIAIKYWSLLWPVKRQREFRFISAHASNGSWHWLPQPINK